MTSTGTPVLIAILKRSPLNNKLPSEPTSCLASGCCSSSAGQASCSRASCTCSAQLTASMGLWNATMNASPSVVTCTHAWHQGVGFQRVCGNQLRGHGRQFWVCCSDCCQLCLRACSQLADAGAVAQQLKPVVQHTGCNASKLPDQSSMGQTS